MSKIKPALPPAQWVDYLTDYGSDRVGDRYSFMTAHARGADDGEDDFQAAAALCLHEQSFGFTHDDVGTLREFARAVENKVLNSGATGTLWMWDLADRIEALLPPEK